MITVSAATVTQGTVEHFLNHEAENSFAKSIIIAFVCTAENFKHTSGSSLKYCLVINKII